MFPLGLLSTTITAGRFDIHSTRIPLNGRRVTKFHLLRPLYDLHITLERPLGPVYHCCRLYSHLSCRTRSGRSSAHSSPSLLLSTSQDPLPPLPTYAMVLHSSKFSLLCMLFLVLFLHEGQVLLTGLRM